MHRLDTFNENSYSEKQEECPLLQIGGTRLCTSQFSLSSNIVLLVGLSYSIFLFAVLIF